MPTAQTSNTGFINIQKNLVAYDGSSIYVNRAKADSLVVNPYTGSKSLGWAYLKVGGNAFLYGTIYVTYNANGWTPAEGDYVRVVDCAGTISGTPKFDLQALPAGLGWDTSKFLTEGVVYVANATGIREIGFDAGSFQADVYTLNGFRMTSLQTSMATLQSDLKSRGLAPGLYIVRTAKGTIKVTLK